MEYLIQMLSFHNSKLALRAGTIKHASGTQKSVTLNAPPAVSPVTLAVSCVVVYPRPIARNLVICRGVKLITLYLKNL